ncbi:hypothetical protein [Sulfurovum sp. NBC37-1]|uniref:Kae1-like domain-containing protein n=1 Tax=Sulfurovum sp. (strain NBC37-1) TaxID=387093 RepID=UPI0001587D1C|nr:hypothetical protein [Sulfurovum sp. NBC37-1]BAF72609.1 hypothetical protein SUN_1659 [Sulfurovum sp. NBC37-1]
MYFIFEMEFASNKTYISDLIAVYSNAFGINNEVIQSKKHISIIFNKEDEKIEPFLLGLNDTLPASIFLGKSRHYFSEKKPEVTKIKKISMPLNISLCPSCQKEMFDVSSRRYYYPFTSCNSCASQHPFMTAYPYKRANSTMKFLVPCDACHQEMKNNPLRKDYPLISCVDCGISLKMNDGKSERYANDKGSYRKLFEVSAAAIKKGKSVLMKTANGYRKFYFPSGGTPLEGSVLLMADAKGLNEHLMMVTQEFNALMSIERPLLRVSTKSDVLKALYGSTVLVKYPDDGMTMLLARELINHGMTYVSYVECEEDEAADFLVDFDIPIEPQRDSKLFVNQDMKFYISGERAVFPSVVEEIRDVVSVAHDLAAVRMDEVMLIDAMERFDSIRTARLNVLEGEKFESGHRNEKPFPQWKGSMMSVLAEHGVLGEQAIGIHFDSSLYFLYYNRKEVINAVPPNPFEADHLFEHISALREGSDRLVVNYRKAYPKICERLDSLNGDVDIFTVTAIMLGLKEESFEGISAEALSFLGKGGIQIDTRVNNNRFDNYAFLASIMSYQLGTVESTLMCYSIYESFGDYIAEVVSQLLEKTKAKNVTLTGETFANQALYARIQRHMGTRNLLFPVNYPIGKECAVYGGIYL